MKKYVYTIAAGILTGCAFIVINRVSNHSFSFVWPWNWNTATSSIQVSSGKPIPDRFSTYSQWVTPTESSVNIRVSDGVNQPILKQAYAGETYPLIRRSGDWNEIALDHDQYGWIAGWLVRSVTQEEHQKNATIAARVNAQEIYLYSGPGTGFSKESDPLSTGEIVGPMRVSGAFVQIVDTHGHCGWTHIDALRWTSLPMSAMRFAEAVPVLANVSEQTPLTGKTIVIDPGHGGTDAGAIAPGTPIAERDVNLAVAQVLSQKLRAAGARVLMTRTTNNHNVSLATRVQSANQARANAFVSIHQNMYAQDPDIHGALSFYYQGNASLQLAEDIESEVLRTIPSQGSNVRSGVEQDELYVLHHNSRPAALIEGCFLSNPSERDHSLTIDYQEALAEGIYRGLTKYFAQS